MVLTCLAGADPGFQVRGRAHLKQIAPSGGGAKIVGVFRVKNHDFTQKYHIFSNFRGGARRVRPPLDPSLFSSDLHWIKCIVVQHNFSVR